MRMGTYKTITTGICVPIPTMNNVTQSGGSNDKKKSPSGTVYPARETAFDSIFGRASTLEKQPPFNMPEEVSGEGASPTDRRCESFQHLHTNRVMKRQGLQKEILTMARKHLTL